MMSFVVDLDGQFTSAVEAAGGDVDGPDDSDVLVRQNQLGVQLDVLDLMNLTRHYPAVSAGR